MQHKYLLSSNLRISYLVPPELGDLSNLGDLFLSYNSLTGAIPPELGDLSNLGELSLEYNSLTGAIPPELGDLSNLAGLYLNNNSLTGAIPPELGNLPNLGALHLYNNSLTGAIPPELGGLAGLEQLPLSENQLTGEIPPELGQLASLTGLFLEGNQLTGEIPPELGTLVGLEVLRVNNNPDLAGALPLALASLSALEEFWYFGTGLYAPADESFRAWLNAIPDHQGNAADAQIIGQVSIEGTGIDGVTVNLSNGNSTTTSGGGSYRFDDVEVGAYTVTISNYPSDAVFDATSVAVTISSAGQSVKADFSGSYIRVASILVSVTVDNVGLSGVTVRLSGTADYTATTDNSGGIAFTGLRMGMYSVEISGYDTDEYEFAITSKDVTVGVGEVVDVVFEGVLLGTSGIAGRVSAGGTGIADVTVTVSADGMGDVTTTTDAGGLYGFAGLSAGDYTVSISGYDTDDYEFEVTSKDVTVARDRTLIVDFEGRAGGGSNQSPVTVGTIPATTLKAGESVTVNASSYFSDPDGDALTYTASSSRTSVATASVSGSVVTVNAVAQGNATIRITARDPVGLSAAQTFSVTVGGTGRDGECVRGATYARGESCDVYGTGSSSKLTFTVLSDGRARLGFITAGNRITVKGTVNGVRYHFVASHQGGGIWRIDEYIP